MTNATDTTLKVRCERDDLLAALQAADAIVPSNSAKPILTNLQLSATADSLEIAATDLQVGLRAVLRRLEVMEPGQVVVPAKSLVSILKESRSPTVLLALEAQDGRSQLRLDLADGDYAIPAVVGETFPPVNAFPETGERFTLPGAELERMLRKTSFAVDRDRTSAVLSGVYLAAGDGEFILAATDGKVLSESVLRDESLQQRCQAIVPAATVAHVARIVSSSKPAKVELALTAKLIFIRVVMDAGEAGGAGNIQVELTSRLVEGSYPAYRNALPTSSQATVTFDAKEFASGVRRTALMTSAASRGIVLELGSHEAVLSNLNNTSGSARIPLSCSYTGSGDRLGLNAQYVSEVLRAYDAESVQIELNGPGKGLIIREEGTTFLIMPITLPN
ncbi:MAG: DNA polymerase III subunit beta [Planctomycetota bacterium]|jgi:DNA polymerase-3 subunit beta|nr:DNA polymerase III subunit beta [Planctomycetota bacterium]